ncbi:MAG: Pr6Pr family membrane protein [Dermatophilaceae bacterium]
MSSTDAVAAAEPVGVTARRAFAVTAAVAWLGVLLTTVLVAFDAYDRRTPLPGLYGLHPSGVAGLGTRMADHISYFTIWSNVVAAVGATLLAWQPERDSFWRRVIRLDGMLMVTVTALVYAVLLRPSAVVTGWSEVTDPILHIVAPAVTVLVWLVWGPRGRVSGRVVLASFIVPVGWIAWMLIRGAVVGAYPYDIVNVVELGYGPVVVTVTVILGFGFAVASTYWALDIALTRALSRSRRPV